MKRVVSRRSAESYRWGAGGGDDIGTPLPQRLRARHGVAGPLAAAEPG
ncbi:MAG: hypothetical protein IVW57_09435 [Ktedonobacterales bacterium]|nr:hypothetical protein [Ktedonobacterales bacterium]